MNQDTLTPKENTEVMKILSHILNKELLVINPRRRNGLILYKRYHADFAGPGAVIGGLFDLDTTMILPVGDLSLILPKTSEERQRSYKIRRQWIKLTTQITNNSVPLQRANMILNQFEHWFGAETMLNLPDEAFARLVGVLPETISRVRNSADQRLGFYE